MTVKGISGDAHFFEETVNIDRIRKLLDSNKNGNAGISEKLEGMKSLLAMISKGEDVSALFADVVKNVVVSSVEVKKMVYMYLVHYADINSQCRELALLSINSFQKDLADSNQLIRALALRVMTSIRVPDIIQIQMIAIRKCAGDSSPYVRKCAATAISKVFVLDESLEQKDALAEIIGKLLNDVSTMVLGSTVQALNEVCPERLDLLHRPFRRFCHLLADMDEWAQIVALNVLMRYTREQFLSPVASDNSIGSVDVKEMFPKRRKKKGFYSDEDESEDDSNRKKDEETSKSPFYLGSRVNSSFLPSQGSVFSGTGAASGIVGGEQLDEDHRLLLRSSLPLLKSRNSAVVMAVSQLHYYCGTQSVATSALIGKSLVRIMRNQREIQYVVLSVIGSMSNDRPDMFRPFLHDFFVRATDPSYSRILKLDILTNLVTEDTVTPILKECQAYVQHSDKKFVSATIRALGRVADSMPSVSDRCLYGLMHLVSSNDDRVVSESVIVIRQLLQRNPDHEGASDVARRLAAMLVRTNSPDARASIVWILGEFRELVKDLVPDALRILAQKFSEEEVEVKIQIVNFAVKAALGDSNNRNIQLLLQYIVELATFDTNYDLRDRVRLIKILLSGDIKQCNPHVVLLSNKPAPLVGRNADTGAKFILGTLSDIVHHKVNGYRSLPDWPTEQPDSSVREEFPLDGEVSFVDAPRSTKNKLGGKKEAVSQFYSSEESESEESSSGSESESSGEGSHSESDADSRNSESDDSSEYSNDTSDDSESDELESNSNVISAKKSDKFDHFDILNTPNEGHSSSSFLNDLASLDMSGT